MTDDKELWDLLGKSPTPKSSSDFTQKVLQAISVEEQLPAPTKTGNKEIFSFSRLISSHRQWVAAACAACLVIGGALTFLPTQFGSGSTIASSDIEAYELAALEETALVLEDVSSPTSLVEVAYCYTDSLSDDELQYVIAML